LETGEEELKAQFKSLTRKAASQQIDAEVEGKLKLSVNGLSNISDFWSGAVLHLADDAPKVPP